MTPAIVRKPFGALCLFGLSLIALGGTAFAAPTSAQQSAIRSACQTDYRANCSSVSPGGAAALQCLQQNLAKLSPSCQSAVNAASGTPAPAAAAPAATDPAAPAPAAAAAPAATPPPAAKPTAKAAPAMAPLPPMTPRQEAMFVRQSCGPDFRSYCSSVRLGGGGAVRCLQANAAKLSPTCRRAFSALAR